MSRADTSWFYKCLFYPKTPNEPSNIYIFNNYFNIGLIFLQKLTGPMIITVLSLGITEHFKNITTFFTQKGIFFYLKIFADL